MALFIPSTWQGNFRTLHLASEPTSNCKFQVHGTRKASRLVCSALPPDPGATMRGGKPARAEAVAKGTAPALPDHVKQLIEQQIARPIFIGVGAPYSSESDPIRMAARAEEAKRFLSVEELASLNRPHEDGPIIAQFLALNVDRIVDESRKEIYKRFPDIDKPGGGLYPEFRAQACWRDFWHFTRVISYAIALNLHGNYLNSDGLEIMRQMYMAFKVPLDAMVVGIESLEYHSRKIFLESDQPIPSKDKEKAWKEYASQPFAGMKAALEQFRSSA
eukprot:CAMPEP_0184696570 /NCGR_PEP_ID=MMETSP0313-20130426/3815_1 /TAXON_ID=2792 /ORGANISM="Porphyridium aerugineum, Strain SAG 1380-2" /LENGTH=274 /DNA_ID=CAMNT_0027155213 /DNA_START=75 /DNA_END=899 /DNA_ORIENTATION=+